MNKIILYKNSVVKELLLTFGRLFFSGGLFAFTVLLFNSSNDLYVRFIYLIGASICCGFFAYSFFDMLILCMVMNNE